MEIISTRTETKAVTVTPDDPRCVALAGRFVNEAGLYVHATDNENTPKADTPSMVLCMKTFGTDVIMRHLVTRCAACFLRMDATALDNEEIVFIAKAITDDPKARVLGYDLVMGFFAALERGEYVLYNFKPRNVMTAWQSYAGAAHTVQAKLKADAERKQRDAEWEAHKAQCITLAEFKRRQQQPLQ